MAYLTGLRRGEILSLRWESINLLNRQVRLNPGETKNGKGRVILLGQELFGMLTSQLAFAQRRRRKLLLRFYSVSEQNAGAITGVVARLMFNLSPK